MLLEKPNHARDKRQEKREAEREWLAMRRLVLDRDLHRCRACNSRDGVDVHHRKFRSAGGKNTPANLLALCRVCQTELHGYRLSIVGGSANGVLRFVRRG